MNNKKIIAILGLMGVGKSTIGAKLADKTKSYFLDCDSEIEDLEKRSIKKIFAESGEKYFREIEKKIIREIVLREETIILSLGGGAFMDQDTRKLLKEKAITIWLQASVDTILHRVGNKDTRPLLNNQNKREILEELMIKRYPTYAEADLKFDTNNINHDLLVNKIIHEIKLLKNEK